MINKTILIVDSLIPKKSNMLKLITEISLRAFCLCKGTTIPPGVRNSIIGKKSIIPKLSKKVANAVKIKIRYIFLPSNSLNAFRK